MINWGIVGLGRIAHKFAQDLAILNNTHLHAVASRSLENAQRFADQYKVQHAFGTYEDLVGLQDLDAVYIATPHASHAALSMFFLENGIAVLCEKPFAINFRETQAMVDTARRTGTFLMEGMWTRFLPHIQKILEIIDTDQLGQVHTMKATFGFNADRTINWRLFNPSVGGGALLDIGVYPVFLAHLLLGKPFEIEANAHISTDQIDETTWATLLYENGRRAELEVTIVKSLQNEAFIYGEKGYIHIPARWIEGQSFTLHLEGQAPEVFTFDLPGHGFYLEAGEVVACMLQERQESNLLPLDFSLDVMETLDRIRQKTGLTYPQDLLSI